MTGMRLFQHSLGAGIGHLAGYEPAWHNSSELLSMEPSGWPNCESGVVTAKDLAGIGRPK